MRKADCIGMYHDWGLGESIVRSLGVRACYAAVAGTCEGMANGNGYATRYDACARTASGQRGQPRCQTRIRVVTGIRALGAASRLFQSNHSKRTAGGGHTKNGKMPSRLRPLLAWMPKAPESEAAYRLQRHGRPYLSGVGIAQASRGQGLEMAPLIFNVGYAQARL